MKTYTLISLFVLIGLSAFLAAFFAASAVSKTPFLKETNYPDEEVLPSKETIPQKDFTPDESVGSSLQSEGSAEGSGGGGSGGGISPDTNNQKNCIAQTLAYSIGTKELFQKCTKQAGETCTQKEVTCTIELKNLDPITTGTFKGVISFFEKEKSQNESFSEYLFEKTLFPKETKSIEAKITISDPSLLEKDFSCAYYTTETPKKQAC